MLTVALLGFTSLLTGLAPLQAEPALATIKGYGFQAQGRGGKGVFYDPAFGFGGTWRASPFRAEDVGVLLVLRYPAPVDLFELAGRFK
ncbi:hypothetical protein EON81_23885, partial [bacterium]